MRQKSQITFVRLRGVIILWSDEGVLSWHDSVKQVDDIDLKGFLFTMMSSIAIWKIDEITMKLVDK